MGHKTTLIASRKNNNNRVDSILNDYYGVDEKIALVTIKIFRERGMEFYIALFAVFSYIRLFINREMPNLIISRNLYSAFLFTFLLRRKIIYETHSPEEGIRMKLQKLLLFSKKVHTVVISEALKKIIIDKHIVNNERISVLHDAAKTNSKPIHSSQRKIFQNEFLRNKIDPSAFEQVVGYFGHLYAGRGIEVIERLANNQNYLFLVFGGNKQEIAYYQNKNKLNNLLFMGHVAPKDANYLMSIMDILLMPYQETVSIGVGNIDTSKWMSPMKMFEYMSCGLPIISSNIPVLREVLMDGHNSLLVAPNAINDWERALKKISDSPELQIKLGSNAYNDYLNKYTWNIRAKAFLDLEK